MHGRHFGKLKLPDDRILILAQLLPIHEADERSIGNSGHTRRGANQRNAGKVIQARNAVNVNLSLRSIFNGAKVGRAGAHFPVFRSYINCITKDRKNIPNKKAY